MTLFALLYTARGFLPGRISVPLDLLADTGAWKPDPVRRVPVSNHLLSDAVLQFVPWDAQARREIAARRFPWRNPYEGEGSHLWANPVTALASPFTWPRLAAGVRGWTLSIFARLCVGGAGAFWLARAMGAETAPAALSGVVFLASGYSILWALHPQSAVLAWLPWLAGALVRLSRRIAPRDTIVAAAAAALATAGGHPETLAFGAAGIVVFAAWNAAAEADAERDRGVRHAAWGALSAAAGFLVLAAQWVPFVGLLRGSWSAGVRRGSASGGFRVFAIPGTILPGFLGSPLRGELDLTGAAPGSENFNVRSEAFVGFVVLVCLALAARVLAPPFRRGLWVGTGALVLAWRVPPVAAAVHALPVAGLAAPEYASAVFVLFAAAASGPAIFLVAAGPPRRRAAAALIAAGAVLVLAGIVPAVPALRPAIARVAERGVELLRARGHLRADAATYASRLTGYLAAIRWTALRRALAPGCCWALAGAALAVGGRRRLPLLVGAALGELLAFGLGYVPAIRSAAVPGDPPTIVAIRRLDPNGAFFMAAAGDEYPADLATAAAVRDARSYDVLASCADVAALAPCGLDPASAAFPAVLDPGRYRCLGRTGVRWWIARNAPGLPRVGGDPAPGVGLYEIPGAVAPPPPRGGPPEGWRAGLALSAAGFALAAALTLAARRLRPAR